MSRPSTAVDPSVAAADRTGLLQAAVAASDPGTGRSGAPPSAVFTCSLTGTVLAAGAALGALSGGAAHDVVGAPALLLLHPSSHARLLQVLRAARGGATSGPVSFRLRRRSGPGVEVHGFWSVLTGSGAESSQLVFVTSGAPAGHAARRRLRMQEAFGGLSREVALVADAHGILRYVSPALGTLFGYDRTAVVPWNVWSYVHADDVTHARTVYGAVVDGHGPQTTTLRIRAAAGNWRWVEVVAVDLLDDDAVGGIVCALHDITDEVRDYENLQASEGMFRAIADTSEAGIWAVSATAGTHDGSLAVVTDVTEVRRAERELHAGALEDGLTRLPNRFLLVDRLTRALARAERSTAVLLVGLDRFSMINVSRGHGVGDQLLVQVGARLRGAVPGHETLARFGGDEFVMVCEDTGELQAHAVAGDLLQVLSAPFHIDGAPVHVAASIGVAVAPASTSNSAPDLLKQADTALHAAKSSGRGRVQGFDQALAADVEHRYALSADLRAALAEDSLCLEYQPIVDLRCGVVVGVEALVRWIHPARGPVAPADFVTVAEVTGLAPELDRWVIQRALRDMAVLRAAGAVPVDSYVAVNLSACNLTDAFVLEHLLTWTEKSGVPATQVVLEITETAILRNTDAAVALLRRLRDRGFRVAMDDFGTGYSSLAHLRDLPISVLKIDRSFVADLPDRQEALAIVASIVDLARAVGVTVIAEGVETTEQSACLQRLGCVNAQGWLWSPAVPLPRLLGGRGWMTSPASGDEAGAAS